MHIIETERTYLRQLSLDDTDDVLQIFSDAAHHRQRGVGRALVTAAEEFGWARGCLRLEVTSGDHRPEAQAFYEHLGYQLDCRRFIKHPRTIKEAALSEGLPGFKRA